MKQAVYLAVLLTCHNRVKKTISCLDLLFSSAVPKNYHLEVYLVDDGSTDGTGEAVKMQYPQVHVIQGNGTLYWNGGMRLAWDTASRNKQFDFYLWLNDDTLLEQNAISELMGTFREATQKENRPVIVTGACQSSNEGKEFSYGGRTESGPVIPNGNLQSCKYINGNVVLVPKAIYEKLGNLSSEYTHAMGDIDYGLKTINLGYNCYTTRIYVATCINNKGLPAWCNPNTSLIKRWKLIHSPQGLNIKEYNTFRRKFWGRKWIVYAVKAYLKALFPSIYFKLSNNI